VRLQRLDLHDFRNFAEARVEFGPRFTVLFGHNGAGKTNVLEALWLLATLRSFRVTDLGLLVRREAAAASVVLRGHDEALGLDCELAVQLRRHDATTRRTALADGKPVRAAIDFYGRVRAVLFTPEDLAVLRGGPTERRQFVDRMLFGRERGHIADVQSYDKLVRSRNRVLKDEALPHDERDRMLDTYESGLADVGARIWNRRERILDELRPRVTGVFAGIHGAAGPDPGDAAGTGRTPEVGLRYAVALGEVAPAERREALARALLERRRLDLQRGATTVGPHRDDVVVELDGVATAAFASQGQTRALVLALKLAELDLATAAVESPPVLLLDDVSSELDPARTALLFAALGQRAGQCVLTTTAPEYLQLEREADVLRWHVDRGRLQRV